MNLRSSENQVMTFKDARSQQIAINFNLAVAQFCDRNSAGWVLDLLSNTRPAAVRGPLAGRRCCDVAIEGFPHILAIFGGRS